MMKTIKSYRYQQYQNDALPRPINALILDCEDGSEVVCPNGPYILQNTKLQVLAALNATPTTVDEIKGQVIEVAKQDGVLFPSNKVCGLGKNLLESAEWFEPKKNAQEVMEEKQVMGGGGPDPGTGNKQETEVHDIADKA